MKQHSHNGPINSMPIHCPKHPISRHYQTFDCGESIITKSKVPALIRACTLWGNFNDCRRCYQSSGINTMSISDTSKKAVVLKVGKLVNVCTIIFSTLMS